MSSIDTTSNMVISMIFLMIFVPVIVIIVSTRSKKTRGSTVHSVKNIKETKCTCQACGNIWYYGKREAWENRAKSMENCGSSMSNTGSDMMCCGGCAPAIFIPKQQKVQVKDLSKCPKCNSSAIRKEEVTHEV